MAAESPPRRRRPAQAIRSMRLGNLRSFADTGQIDIAPTNFLFGKNSSGKTTILRALLLFRQLVSEQTMTGEVPFVGPYADFGSYKEAVFNGEKSRDILLEFDLSVDSRYLSGSPSRLNRQDVRRLQRMRVTLDLHWNASRGHAQYNCISFSDPDNGKLLYLERLGPNRFKITLPGESWSRTIEDESELNFGSLSLGILRSDSLSEGKASAQAEIYSFELYRSVLQAVGTIHHVGPLRDMPERAYRLDRVAIPSTSTQHVLGLLVNNDEATRDVSDAMRALGVARQVELISPAPGYAGIVIRNMAGGRKDNLADVGFGVSQVLPILARIATSRPNSLILIEQPELHLHPETQGRLVDVMIDMATRKHVALFIESHSESMLLRLRRRVAEGELHPSDLHIYVTDNGEVRRASIGSDGGIDIGAFPKDFFEEDWIDAVEIARSARANR